ncbi:hypothetical protein CTEN210_17512 [Chaetoceros tenuissimus]|uniref:Uncharacterized protein n=1 Tax=Chaetoceros tenuissimus TaxID=426638 RepID=A0AAD3HF57_9STRA|nr:hypothetical protein CTEN210_17512 [Chaetoceros tenuissimus]
MTVSKSTGSASVPPLSISHAREGVSVLGNSNRQGHQKPLSHEGNDKNASDADISMDLLAMPDPPTPDTRVHNKMSAAALEMRRRRRKSRRLSGHIINTSNNTHQPNQALLRTTTDGLSVPNNEITTQSDCNIENDSNRNDNQLGPSSREISREATLPVDDQKRNAAVLEQKGNVSDSVSKNEVELDVSNHATLDDSNMDWTEGDSLDLEVDDNDRESVEQGLLKQSRICFDDDSDEEEQVAPEQSTQKIELDYSDENNTCNSNRKRTRQSMLVPSQDQIHEFISDGDDRQDFFSPSKKMRMESPEKNNRQSQGRKGGRRSLLLPSEILGDDKDNQDNMDFDENITEKEQPLKIQLTERNPNTILSSETSSADSDAKMSAISITNESFGDCTNESTSVDMDEINMHIRKYCSLPLHMRFKSEEAVAIETLTGYPITSTMDKMNKEKLDNGTISTPIKLSQRSTPSSEVSPKSMNAISQQIKQSLFEKIRPLITIMENKKTQDTAQLEEATKCRVERRKGKFRYVSLDTGTKVSSKEYERRYLQHIVEGRTLRCVSSEETTNSVEKTSEPEKHASSSNHDDSNSKNILEDDIEGITIPSRDDEIPSDPEMAKAQEKLFAAMDAALDEYVDTVLRIRASKKSQG